MALITWQAERLKHGLLFLNRETCSFTLDLKFVDCQPVLLTSDAISLFSFHGHIFR